jgi:hypothetical protein
MARLLLAILAAILLAAPASADPQCNQISPGTRTCVAPGHTSIVTTPNPALMNPSPGWVFGWGTPVIGLGGGGFWLGF